MLAVRIFVARFAVLELKVKFAFVFGEILPVASTENSGKVVVSVASLATVIVVELVGSAAQEVTPAPSV